MNSAEREMIEQLFGKLEQAERQSLSSGQMPESEALALIRQKVASTPNAPYYMAQAIVVQEEALKGLAARVEQLEYELANRPAQQSGGFLSSLFGGGSQPQRRPQTPPRQPGYGQQGYGQQGYGQQGHGRPFQSAPQGGFMAGAMQTAVGVAGGVLLGNAVASMFAGDATAAVTDAAAGAVDSAAGAVDSAVSDVAPIADEGGGFFDSFGGGDDESFF